MSVPSLLQQRFGGQWTAARVHLDELPDENVAEDELRLCEAISRSFERPMVMPVEKIACAGACRSLGVHSDDPRLAETISADVGVEPETLLMMVRETSALTSPAAAVSLGNLDPADVVLGFVQPAMGMLVIRRWQQVFEMAPTVEISSFMAICGNVLVAAYEGSQLCLSLGCPYSRRFGVVRDDTLIVGMPFYLAKEMVSEDPETKA
jgi:uncharacterized protein (DUF169 family)